MPLDRDQVRRLVSSVAETRDDEIDCDACLAGMAEFAELELVGAEIPEAVRRIQIHLSLCTECAEEYAALLEVVRAEGAGPPAK